MALVKDFSELRCYQSAFENAMVIFEQTKAWPVEERYSLTSQIRRSSRAICASIAECWGKRRYPQHFVSKLTDAESKCDETRVWLDFACACEYIDESIHVVLVDAYRQISGSLVKMMADADAWCGPSILREVTAGKGQ